VLTKLPFLAPTAYLEPYHDPTDEPTAPVLRTLDPPCRSSAWKRILTVFETKNAAPSFFAFDQQQLSREDLKGALALTIATGPTKNSIRTDLSQPCATVLIYDEITAPPPQH
jgi:hypothetical protein